MQQINDAIAVALPSTSATLRITAIDSFTAEVKEQEATTTVLPHVSFSLDSHSSNLGFGIALGATGALVLCICSVCVGFAILSVSRTWQKAQVFPAPRMIPVASPPVDEARELPGPPSPSGNLPKLDLRATARPGPAVTETPSPV